MRVLMRATTTTWLGLLVQGQEYEVPDDQERRFLPYLKAGIAVRLDTPRADVPEPETAEAPTPETAAAKPAKKPAKKKAAKKKRAT